MSCSKDFTCTPPPDSLGTAAAAADAGALQDFLFKPSAAVLKRVGAILASSPRPCDLGVHLIAADRTSEWGTKKGDESWLRTVAEAASDGVTVRGGAIVLLPPFAVLAAPLGGLLAVTLQTPSAMRSVRGVAGCCGCFACT